MKNGLLRKLTAFSLAAVMAFTAAACAGGETTESTTASAAPSSVATEEATEQPTDDTQGTDAPTETEGETDATETDVAETEDGTETESSESTEPGEATPDVPANRYDATAEPRTGANESQPLVIGSGEFSGIFSPFFYTSSYDRSAMEYTQIGLLSGTQNGEMVANNDEPSFAHSYSIEVNDDQTESVYKFVLKNGITFSDGQPVTAKDVLFSMHVLSDAVYDGLSTFYTMNIEGLQEYRFQTSSENIAKVNAILEAGLSGDGSALEYPAAEAPATAEDQAAFWAYWDEAGELFAQEIIDMVVNNYGTDAYAANVLGEGATFDQIAGNTNKETMFAMAMWGYGSVADGTFTTKPSETTYDFENDEVTAKNFFDEIMANFGYNLSSDDGVNYESAGTSFEEFVQGLYMDNEGASSGGVDSISGIVLGTETGEDGIERETITVTIAGVDPTAIFKFSTYVVPSHYYTEGYDGELTSVGTDPGNPAFMEHLKSKNSEPMGAGPYTWGGFQDNVVTLVANDNYLMGSPKIKTLRIQQISAGTEMDSLLTDTIHYANPSASMDIINDITAGDGDYAKLDYALVDNDGYGYIAIQGQAIPDFRVRQAIAHAFNVELSISDFYGELASANYRTMTKVLWAYPDNPEPLYPYDGTGETSKALYIEAGYIYDEAANVMYYPEDHEKAGQQVSYTYTIPSNTTDHPAGVIYLDAQQVMAKIGVEVNIEVDTSLLDKTNTAYESGLEVFTLAWGSGGVDPDMFQIWYSDPAVNTGTSAARTGLYWLFENGSEEEKDILNRLNELITAGRSTLDQEERKAIYAEALDLSTSLAVEVPTYQRKNMLAYNSDVINVDTLIQGDAVTPFQGPLADIWNVELNG